MGMAWSLPLVSGKQSLNFQTLVFFTNFINERQNIILFVSKIFNKNKFEKPKLPDKNSRLYVVLLQLDTINRTLSICTSYLCLIFRTKRAVIRELWCAWNIGEGLGMFMGAVTALPQGTRDTGMILPNSVHHPHQQRESLN